MADVKWIKITTDMFDNRKIKHLRRLPDGNNIVLIWMMLLTMAGRCNAGGMIFLTETIPYTPKMLADELDFEENTVQLALSALERLGMVATIDGYYSIANWAEHQNIEGMDKLREQNRRRVSNHRAKQKQLQSNVTSNVTVTLRNATEEDIDKEEEIDKEKKEIKKEKADKPPRATRFIPPTIDEVTAYCRERNNKVNPEQFIDHYTANGWMVGKNKMKDWKASVRTWERRDGKTKAPVDYGDPEDFYN